MQEREGKGKERYGRRKIEKERYVHDTVSVNNGQWEQMKKRKEC